MLSQALSARLFLAGKGLDLHPRRRTGLEGYPKRWMLQPDWARRAIAAATPPEVWLKCAENICRGLGLKRFAAIAAIVSVLFATSASALDGVQIEIVSVDEQAGRMAVSVQVIDSAGRPIGGLSTVNFKVALEGAPLSVSDVVSASATRVPASILLLVDVSGSMQGEPMQRARSAMQEFVKKLDPADQVAIMTFSSGVTLLQDFTANRSQLSQAINKLTPTGDTALYDAVIQAAEKIGSAPAGRRLVVLLSDGEATVGVEKRAASLQAAQAGGVGFVALGVGAQIDRPYLAELAGVSGGRFIEAPTPSSLRDFYVDLAEQIRSQYTLIVAVPPAVDRSVPGRLSVTVSLSAGSATAERLLNPLPGATAPPFDLGVGGIEPGQRLGSPVTLQPVIAAGVALARVEYWVDGQLVYAAAAEPFSYEFDPGTTAKGSHLIEVVAIDTRGRRGEAQVPFSIGAASGSILPSAGVLIAILIGLALLGAASFMMRRKRRGLSGYVDRIKPWAGKMAEISGPVEGWPAAPPPLSPAPPPREGPRARIIVMDEAGVRNGRLDVIREYAIGRKPLTFGTSESCDISVADQEDGRIAAEEARLWVRGGRLVYHKLTTLSAMATEGVTSGWHFLESGEEIRVGAYRIVFQFDAPAEAEEGEPEEQPETHPDDTGELSPPQEHGMALREPGAAPWQL